MLGEIVVRKTGTMINGKEAVIIAGIVALDELEHMKLKGEHQYIITGCDIYDGYEMDLTETMRGMNIDGILGSQIWRL